MRCLTARWGLAVLSLLLFGSPPGAAFGGMLTFDERVAAQEALERAHYGHQNGATRPFAVAFPREILERRVRTYLRQSVALETLWNTPVSGQMLHREVERMAERSRMPERLQQLFDALAGDALLVEECLARQVLVDRLARGFFAFDGRIHVDSRKRAAALREDLALGRIDPWDDHDARTLQRLLRDRARGEEGETAALTPLEYERRRRQFPDRVGDVGPVVEEREAYVVRVVLAEDDRRTEGVSYSIPKRTWDDWWREAADGLDDIEIPMAADARSPLPPLRAAREGCAPDGTWDNGSLDDLGARREHTVVWTGSEMIVWGGHDLHTGSRYDPATDSWTPVSSEGAPGGRKRHAAVWTGSEMIVWGGSNDSSPSLYLATGGRYDPISDTWTPTSTIGAPADRDRHTAVWTGSQMIVWGGYSMDGPLNSGGRYDPLSDSWTSSSITVSTPAARYDHTALWTGSRMIIWAGWNQTNAFSSGGLYDPVLDTWTVTAFPGVPQPRRQHAAVWTGDTMVVWGGKTANGVFLGSGGRYDPILNSWLATSNTGAPQARAAHTAVWTGNSMVLWGGETTGDVSLNTGARYDPRSDSWATISMINTPPARYDQTVVWTGSLMIVWGGWTGSVVLDSGGRYDPAVDTWTPTSNDGVPGPRIFFTAVWTGNVMVVWGGNDGVYLNTGGRYDPVTDSWTPTSLTNVPSARNSHTAVWTGSVMVVWGGSQNGGGWPLTGGRYDPVLDSWTPTTLSGAPNAREQHSAVWTGSVMVVWGGRDIVTLGTGARYDPVSDVWQPTATTGAPPPARGHTAVWTGTRMIVWGGSSASPGVLSQTGGRYDPVANTWTPTSLLAAPQARRQHSAVWTGSHMIVWGGEGGSGWVDTGGRYDPVSNLWRPTSIAVAPEARADQQAVWTGSLMIVWGGVGFNSGGRYDPLANNWAPTELIEAPRLASGHRAVWTGEAMLVWGGLMLNRGGRYFPGEDADCDGHADTFDCAVLDETTFASPAEVTGLAASGVMLNWNSAAPASGTGTIHDLVVGSVDELPVGSGAGESCLVSTGASSTTHSDAPEPGSAYWYLVRARNACGVGTYGVASDGSPRATEACP